MELDDKCLLAKLLFFFNDTATTEIYTLSLHDALPISPGDWRSRPVDWQATSASSPTSSSRVCRAQPAGFTPRSEEHTSELQSPCNLVCRLLLEKKKTQNHSVTRIHTIPQHASQLNQLQ